VRVHASQLILGFSELLSLFAEEILDSRVKEEVSREVINLSSDEFE
jgi:hypothetical protein